MDFGPGMTVRSPVTAWDPPRTFAAQGDGWGGSPPIATEWTVEARGGGQCLVRVVNSLFASTDDWDGQLEGTESGWPGFFRTLRIYLAHFRGQRSALVPFVVPVDGSEAEAWETATSALGLTRPGRRTAVDGAGRRPRVRRRGRIPQRASVRRAVAARRAGAGRRGARHLRHGRPHHGGDELLPLWRAGGARPPPASARCGTRGSGNASRRRRTRARSREPASALADAPTADVRDAEGARPSGRSRPLRRRRRVSVRRERRQRTAATDLVHVPLRGRARLRAGADRGRTGGVVHPRHRRLVDDRRRDGRASARDRVGQRHRGRRGGRGTGAPVAGVVPSIDRRRRAPRRRIARCRRARPTCWGRRAAADPRESSARRSFASTWWTSTSRGA